MLSFIQLPSFGVTMGLGGENEQKWIFTVLVIYQDPENFNVILFGTVSGTFGEKNRSVAQSVSISQPFENYPAFWPKST